MFIKKNLEKLNNFTKFSKWTELFDRKGLDKLEVEQHLFKKKILDYKGSYENDLLEQYKLYVELMDRINERVQQSYYSFLTINSAIVGGLGYFQIHAKEVAENVFAYFLLLIISYLALIFCLGWLKSIKSLRDHYERRLEIIKLIEEKLPLSLFNTELKLHENIVGAKSGFRITYVLTEGLTLVLFSALYSTSFIYHIIKLYNLP